MNVTKCIILSLNILVNKYTVYVYNVYAALVSIRDSFRKHEQILQTLFAAHA